MFLCVFFSITAYGLTESGISTSKLADERSQIIANVNMAFMPFGDDKPISGLSISGLIKKTSPDYVARVILTDKDGNEYLILEMYEEINQEGTFIFKDYSDETQFLSNIVPDSIKVFIKDASIQINSITIREASTDTVEFNSNLKLQKVQRSNSIVERINEYNTEKGRPWIAGITELSMLPYEKRRRVLGFPEDMSTGGLEYYIGGYFLFGHEPIAQKKSLNNDPFVDSFDWRNRHGKNWMTSVKHQGWTEYCMAFATLGCLEALTKLYYNNASLEVDLSEQEIASCSDSSPRAFYEGIPYDKAIDYVYEHGVCDEAVYPLDTLGYYNPAYNLTCNSEDIIPNEFIRTGSPKTSFFEWMYDIKRKLISEGPLISGWEPSSLNENGHAMALVGYGKVGSTDTITYYNPNTNTVHTYYLSVPPAYIGSTYWIFKNSYGSDNLHGGYYYMIFNNMIGDNSNILIQNMILPSSLGLPIISLNYTDDDIIIEDADGDGYYNWGIGEKPQDCPLWIPDVEDGDDSDSEVAEMDAYGHLHPISTRPSWTLSSDYTYGTGNSVLAGDIVVPNGCTLTIAGGLMCTGTTTITVEAGGNLIIDGGVLANANLILSSSSRVRIKNDGTVYMRKDHDFSAPLGCVVEIEKGTICGPFKKISSIFAQ